MAYKFIISEKKDDIGLIILNRPEVMNALSEGLMEELASVLDDFEADKKIGCTVVTGSEKAFAAGADIKEMQSKSYMDAYLEDFISHNWERVTVCRKPVIAAVAGYALGGGCELAMMCDFIIAGDNAKFGQPEVTLGVIPGVGGSQRLSRLVGKSKAMEMCLTGRMMDAEEAERAGLVSRIVPVSKLLDEAIETASKISAMSRPISMMIKESVNRSYETTLAEGLRFERRLFHSAFAIEDQKEGMESFVLKRKPVWKNR